MIIMGYIKHNHSEDVDIYKLTMNHSRYYYNLHQGDTSQIYSDLPNVITEISTINEKCKIKFFLLQR